MEQDGQERQTADADQQFQNNIGLEILNSNTCDALREIAAERHVQKKGRAHVLIEALVEPMLEPSSRTQVT